MKKILYLCICALMFCTSKSDAQYYITSHSWTITPDTFCSAPQFNLATNAYSPALSIKTYYLNGKSISTTVLNGGSYGYANIPAVYLGSPGTYTTKHILYNSSTPIDSVNDIHEYLYCNILTIKAFNDIAGTGIYDGSVDPFIMIPIQLQVSQNGITIDTLTMVSGIYYQYIGVAGDIYSFKIISVPYGLNLTYPVAGIIYDTITNNVNNNKVKYFGFQCNGTSSFDLAVNAVIRATGIRDQRGNIYVTNSSCNPTNATVTMNFSPKYVYDPGDAQPTPSSVSGNTVTWNLTGITTQSPVDLWYQIWDDADDLVAGDTVQEHITVTPTTGDSNPANNVEVIIDSVSASEDPNEMSVTPSGYISSGTQLQYTIGFENTGNDTAYNISVYDTLSPNVDPKSLKLIMASAVMNIAQLNQDGYNIVKFDFPNINLLDSSHHGQCDGAVIFTINSNSGLPDGTTIFNHAGIFFDYNPVVMTNTVEDVIGVPSGVVTVTNATGISLYPNPANDELTIKTSSGAYNTATFTNIIGQTLITQQLNATQTNVNVKALLPGIYYITLIGDSGVSVQKFEKL